MILIFWLICGNLLLEDILFELSDEFWFRQCLVDGGADLVSKELVSIVESVQSLQIVDECFDYDGRKTRLHKLVRSDMNESLNDLQDLDEGLPIKELLLRLVLRFFAPPVHLVRVCRIVISYLGPFFEGSDQNVVHVP